MTVIKIFEQQFQPEGLPKAHRQVPERHSTPSIDSNVHSVFNYGNYFQFNLLIPDFIIWQQEQDSLETQSRNIRISFGSKLVFYIDEDMWILEVQLLGFGFGIVRQWDY